MGNTLEKDRIDKILDTVMKVARGDYSVQIELSGKNDEIDSLAMGLNMMIDDIRRSEETLRESEEKYQALIESTSDWGWQVDADGVYTYASPKVKELLGYEPEEVIGKTPFDLMPPEEAKRVSEEFRAIVESQRPFAGLENTNLHKDGRLVVLETSGVPFLDTAGRFCGYRGIDRDITERKRVEESLKIYQDMVESAKDAIFFKDLESRYIVVNDKALEAFGLPLEEVIGKNDYEIMPNQEEAKKNIEDDQLVFKTGKPTEIIKHMTGDDGKEYWFHAVKVPHFDDKRSIIGIIGVARDITERKHAEAEREALLKDLEIINRRLEESNRELQNFVYIASHDLREPLRKITSFGTLLQDSLGGKLDEDQQENFEFMIDGSKRMQAMIDDLLTYSRVTTKAKSFQQVNLNNVIEDLKNLELAVLLDETKGTIYVPEMLPPAYGDSSQIHQLL